MATNIRFLNGAAVAAPCLLAAAYAAALMNELLLQQQYLAGFSMNKAELPGMQSANAYLAKPHPV
ncbi:hypothetical protein [Aquitalea sp. ASV15]|uniref:hypothetical protein n=1 Tax=Aquitalea sp. ASV15 TaxID=2795104 RepID=UPI0018ECD1B8|nr:hypothetical protein [Aquitalea sp. ASV15]